MSHFHHKKFILILILAISLWSCLAFLSDTQQILISVKHISLKRIIIILGLSALNYWFRIIRFNFFTQRVAVRPIKKDINTLIFFSGLSMNLTPARVGEVVKAYFQRQFFKESFARMAPIAFVERLCDALAMLMMMSLGVLAFKLGFGVFLFLILIAGTIILILHKRTLSERMAVYLERFSWGKKMASPLRRVLQTSYRLTGILPISWGTVLGVAAWSAEALGLFVLAQSVGVDFSLRNIYLSVFTFAAAAAAGFVSILPAGLGVNELSTIGLLEKLLALSSAEAIVVTFAFRLATLWFGVMLGIVSLIYLEKRSKL